jgi:Protein of unknown function (DUF3617)
MRVSCSRLKQGDRMQTFRLCAGAACALALSSGAALAGHGHAGLWNTATTMDMSAAMPPEAAAQMKAMGMSMPAARTFSSQVCMSQADVDSDKAPPVGADDSGCTTRVTSQTASSMSAQMVCDGKMKGTGQMQIAYAGADHYSGSFSFQGTMEGQPSKSSSTFKGDWVKADCGGIKPRSPR